VILNVARVHPVSRSVHQAGRPVALAERRL